MFDNEIKKLYAELQQELKSKFETSLANIEQEISSIRNNIVTRLNDMITSYGIQMDSNVIENVVDSTLVEDLKLVGKNVLGKNYQTLYQFNGAINSSIVEQAQKQISKEVKSEQIKVVLDKFDYTMSEYKKSKIDLLEHYNRLFQSVLKSSPLYSTPELVQDIKNFLSAEKENMEKFIQEQRNNIISANLERLVSEQHHLVETTDLVSTAVQNVEQQVQQAVKKEEEKLEEQIYEEQYHNTQVEQEVKKEQEIVNQKIEEQFIQEQQKQVAQLVYSDLSETQEKNLSVPSFKSNESEYVESRQQYQHTSSQTQTSENYRILDDGTIEWIGPHKRVEVSDEYSQMLSELDQPSAKVSNDQMLVNIIKKNLNDNLWNEIGIMASNTDNTIDILSNQTLSETQAVLAKYGIQNNENLTRKIVSELNSQLREINNNLSTNMIRSFAKTNEETVNSISQTFYKPNELKEQDLEQCMDVYRQSTSLASFRLTCDKQFEQCMSKICYEYKINKPSNVYNKIARIMENKRVQMESQFYNMYTSFANSNSMFIDKAMGSSIMTQDIMREMQQDFTPEQIQQLIGYNYQEYEKNYYMMKAEQDLQELRGMAR